MNSKLLVRRGILFAGLALLSVAVYLFARQLPDVSPDAVSSLGGAIVGALIAASVQSWTGVQDRRNQLRIAALDQRLAAHQKAFALWRRLVSHAHDEDTISGVVMECQEWWDNNCLYLDPRSREAFRYAYMCAHNHKSFKQDRSNVELVKKNWADILAAGEALVEGVAMPTIGDLEGEYIDKDGTIKKY